MVKMTMMRLFEACEKERNGFYVVRNAGGFFGILAVVVSHPAC
jgi:hypothetical protein